MNDASGTTKYIGWYCTEITVDYRGTFSADGGCLCITCGKSAASTKHVAVNAVKQKIM
jgi:hypothetical protein